MHNFAYFNMNELLKEMNLVIAKLVGPRYIIYSNINKINFISMWNSNNANECRHPELEYVPGNRAGISVHGVE